MKTKLLIFLIVTTVMIGTVVYIIRGARRRRNTLPETIAPDQAAPVAFIGGGGGVSGGGGIVPYDFVINSVERATSLDPALNWWPYTWKINITESIKGLRLFVVKIKQGSTVLKTFTADGINTVTTPFLTFVPANCNIETSGQYTVELSTNVNGTTVVQSAPFTIANADLEVEEDEDEILYDFGMNTARDPQWWPHTWRITLSENLKGNHTFQLKFKTSGGVLITQPSPVTIDTNNTSFLTFVPVNNGMSTPGQYIVEVVSTVNGTTVTRSNTITLQTDDFTGGVEGDPIITGGALESFVRTARINIQETDGVYSDTTSDTDSGYVAYYYVNGRPYKNGSGGRKKFENETLAPGLLLEVSKVFVDPAHFPDWPTLENNMWIAGFSLNPEWIRYYAQQNFVTQ